MLKQLGSSLVIANRYLPERYLIGPVLSPLYLFVLKVAVWCALVPSLLAWLGLLIDGPFHATGLAWTAALRSVGSSFGAAAFTSAGAVTIIFAILDRVQEKTRFLDDSDPRKLPRVRNPRLIPRTGSSIEFAVNFAWFVFGRQTCTGRLCRSMPACRLR